MSNTEPNKVAGVGSRTVPESTLEIMIRLGRTYTDLGWMWSSGDAYDSDRAFLYGAEQSDRYLEVGAQVFLHKDGANKRWVAQKPFYYDASTFDADVSTLARTLACQARGGFYGLFESGIALHTRNVYQIHSADLQTTVKAIWYYAQPEGRRESEKVKGGTNTAVRLCVDAGVPLRKNLYYADVIDEALAWLAEHESDKPYLEIDWTQIHDPRDPRILDFE